MLTVWTFLWFSSEVSLCKISECEQRILHTWNSWGTAFKHLLFQSVTKLDSMGNKPA